MSETSEITCGSLASEYPVAGLHIVPTTTAYVDNIGVG
jgi:hypothetical protein